MLQKSICAFLASTLFLNSVAVAAALPSTGDADLDHRALVLHDTTEFVLDYDPAETDDVLGAFARIPTRIARSSADGTLTPAEVYAVAVQAAVEIEAVAGADYLAALCASGELPEICVDSTTTGAEWADEVASTSAFVDMEASDGTQLAGALGAECGGSQAAASTGAEIGEVIGASLGTLVGGLFGGVLGAGMGFGIGGALGKMIGALFDKDAEPPPPPTPGGGSGGGDNGGGDTGGPDDSTGDGEGDGADPNSCP